MSELGKVYIGKPGQVVTSASMDEWQEIGWLAYEPQRYLLGIDQRQDVARRFWLNGISSVTLAAADMEAAMERVREVSTSTSYSLTILANAVLAMWSRKTETPARSAMHSAYRGKRKGWK